MSVKRFRRSRAVIAIALCILTVVILHLFTSTIHIRLFIPNWSKHGSPPISSLPNDQPKAQHIIFVKVHKAASTTLMNIFIRYGLNNGLTMMIPKFKNILNEHGVFSANNVLPPLGNKTYDILCNHVIFNRTFLSPLFPPDAKYIAILREPFDQTLSAFMYYRFVYPLPYLWKIKADNPVSEYLKQPEKYEPKNATKSFTNNRMSLDLGYHDVWSRNVSDGRDFIRELQDTFHLILIAEYFDESVVLMKRILNWDLKDVLYISSNALKKGHDLTFSPEDRLRHKKWAWVDHMIYDHFYRVFWDKINVQGKDFFREVQSYKEIRHLWQNFCSQKLKEHEVLDIPAGPWNKGFQVTAYDCLIATTKEIPLMDVVRQTYYAKVQGRNPSWQKGLLYPFLKSRISKQTAKSTAYRVKQTNNAEWIKYQVKTPNGGYKTKQVLGRKSVIETKNSRSENKTIRT